MPSTSSHHPNPLRLVPAPAGGPRRLPRARTRRTGLGDRHVLVVGPDDPRDRTGIGAHTAGLTDHLATAAASVGVLPAPGASAGARMRPVTPGFPHPPDVVVAVLPGLGAAASAARTARRHGIPLVLVVHHLLSARTDGAGGRGLTIAAAAERRLVRAAARVAVVVPELAEVLTRLGVPAEHVHVLPHWAPSPTGPQLLTGPLTDRAAARRELGWPVRPFTVVAAGARADVPTVRDAAARLEGEAAFVVLDDVTSRLPPVAADVLLLTERPDAHDLALPRTLARCLAAGRPVVAAVAEGGAVASELARTGGAGIVVPPGRPDLLAAAIRSLRADEALRTAMGHAAALHACGHLDRGATMLRLEALLCSALGQGAVDLTTA